MQYNLLRALLLLVAFVAVSAVVRAADEPAGGAPAAAQPEATPTGLAGQQQQVAERFRELERLLLRMAELTAPTDPRRAALLRKAVAQSKDRDLDNQFQALVELLREERLAAASKSQDAVQTDLVKLLELLLSEDRSKRLESEKERIRAYLKQVNQIIREQKAVRGETEREGEAKELAERQGDLSNKTGELAKNLKEDAGPNQPQPDDKPGEKPEGESPDKPSEGEKKDGDGEESDAGKGDKQDGENKDGKKKEGERPNGEKADTEKKDTEKKDSETKDGENKDGKSQGKDGEKQDGEQSEGKSQDGPPPVEPPDPNGQPQQGGGQQQPQPQQEQNPAQQRLEQAQKRMQEAQEKLEQAKREDATEKQAEAIKELEQAKAELEEILRQLREEEMARTLAMLEVRFRKMLEAQVEIYEGTKRLDQTPADRRDRDDEIEAGRLSRKEAQLAVEAEKALDILREEGSAVAFPEAVVEIRDDMLTVRDRLAETKTGEVTQGVEQDIIAALEEMIAALDKAQKDQEQQQQQQQPGEAGEPGEMPLVDRLAEIRMIRALQMRVNTRTKRYAEMTKTEQVDEPQLLEALKQLADREQRIHRVTRDIVVGRNR